MARTALEVTSLSRDGVAGPAEVDGDPTNQHSVPNSGRMWVEVRNASADTAHEVTLVTKKTVDGQAVDDRTVSVPFGETRRVGTFPPAIYGRELHIDVGSAELKLRAFAH